MSIFNKKHILEIHDDILIESRIVQILIKYFHILNYKPLIKIVTTTNALKRRYDDYGVELKKVKVLHNASAFESKFKSLNKKKKKYLKIGYFGAIFKSRGIDLIIKLYDYFKLYSSNKVFGFSLIKRRVSKC